MNGSPDGPIPVDRRSLLRRGLPVALIGLAGCAGDGPGDTPTPTGTGTATDSSTPTDATTETPSTVGTPTDASTPTRTDAPTDTRTDAQTPTPTDASTVTPDQRVLVGPDGDFRFRPETFELRRGDTVLWTWASGGHNVSPGTRPAGADWPGHDGEFQYPAGTTHAHTFEVAGSYEYHCDPHRSLGMVGSFTVE